MKRLLALSLSALLLACASPGPANNAAAQPAPGEPAAPAPGEAAAVEAAAKDGKAAATEPAVPLVLSLARPKGGEWFGLYVLGKKAGWVFTDLTKGELAGRPVVIERSAVAFRASVGGVEATREVSEERFYEYKDGGRLVAFSMNKDGDGGKEQLIGACTPSACQLTRKRPGMPDEVRKLPATKEVVEHADAPRLAIHTGKKIEGFSIDLEDTLEDKRMVTEVEGEATLTAGGVSTPVVRTRTVEDQDKMPMVASISKDGRVLELKFGEVMIGKAEPEESAKQLDHVDLFALTRVVLPAPLDAGVHLPGASITWEVEGLPKDFRIESPRQKFEEDEDGTVRLTISSKLPQAKATRPVAAARSAEIKDALKTTLAVEAEAPAIVDLAKKLVGDVSDAWSAARRLNLFVNRTLEKTYGSSSDRATDVLAAQKGDCTEHSLLLTALARAAGIPARRVDGLVYMLADDGVPALYWHEWVEVWVGEWVAIDPTFNQTVADPTHIALGSEGRSDTAGLIGQLKFIPIKQKAGKAQ